MADVHQEQRAYTDQQNTGTFRTKAIRTTSVAGQGWW